MEEYNWADFGSPAADNQVAANDDDDDWAEFGGFESATPAVNGSNQSGSLITWAAVEVPPLVSSTPSSLKPSTADETASAFASPSLTSDETNKPHAESLSKPVDHTDFIKSFLSSDEDFSAPFTAATSSLIAAAKEKSLNETTAYPSFQADFSSSAGELNQQSLSQHIEMKDSVFVDKYTDQVVSSKHDGGESLFKKDDFPEPGIVAVNQPLQENAPDTFKGNLGKLPTDHQRSSAIMFEKSNDGSIDELSEKLQTATSTNEKLEENMKGLEEKLSIAEEEKLQLRKELDALLEKIKPLEDETKNLQEILAKQKEKYEQLQEQHQEQITEIRKAGHDALAVIVEEYKELSRKVVLEQQEENKIRLETVLEDQKTKFQSFLQDQQESFQRLLQEESQKNEKKALDLLEDEKQRHKAEIEAYLEEEKIKSKEALKKAMEDAREQNYEAIEATRTEERKKYEDFVAEYREAIKTSTDQEGKRLQSFLEESMKEANGRNQVALESSLTEERKRGRQYAEEVKEQTKMEMLKYLAEKQEADKAARQKHLHCLDLFLESARAQLKALMEEQFEKDPLHQSNEL